MARFLSNYFICAKHLSVWCFFILIACEEKPRQENHFDESSYNAKRKELTEVKDQKKETPKSFLRKDDDFDYSLLKPPTGKYKHKQFNSIVTAKFYTNYGDMVFELYPKRMPLAVENFINLARNGYYKGCEFFRIEESFIVQAGDRTNTGYADAGYYFKTESHPDLTHDRFGVLSYANNNKQTNSSQFFITLSGSRELDKQHPPFGFLMKGHDILREIGELPVDENSRPVVKVVIRNIKITGI